MKEITVDQAHQIEMDHNVIIDIDTMSYNTDVNATYGWQPIPIGWLQLTDKSITVCGSDQESDKFVEWLNDNGYDAELGDDNKIDGWSTSNTETDANEVMNILWDAYCNA